MQANGYEAFKKKSEKEECQRFEARRPLELAQMDILEFFINNPYWNLPTSVASNETLPKLKKGSHYLVKHNMRIFQGWEADDPELDATIIDWSKISKKDICRRRIRMSRPAEMAAWVLGGGEKGWRPARVEELIASGKRQVLVLDQPVAIYTLYRTVFVKPEDGDLYFYEDICGRD